MGAKEKLYAKAFPPQFSIQKWKKNKKVKTYLYLKPLTIRFTFYGLDNK